VFDTNSNPIFKNYSNYGGVLTMSYDSTNNIIFTKNNTSLGTCFASPATANTSLADSLSLSQGVSSKLYSFMGPSAIKTLYLGNSDALLDRSLTNPEEAYDIDNN
jgi:hypothetical protein